MCSDHLKNTEIIPHIHKTQKQKVCDDCVSGKNTKVAPPSLPPSATVVATPSVTEVPPSAPLRPTAPVRTPPPLPSSPPPPTPSPSVMSTSPPPLPATPPPMDAPTLPPPPVPVASPPPVPEANSQSNPIQLTTTPNKLASKYAANIAQNKEETEKKPPSKPVVGKRSCKFFV